MEILKLLLVFLMIVLSAVSPIAREAYSNYIYAGGLVVSLLSAYVSIKNGRTFERLWGVAFVFLALHQGLNLMDFLPPMPFIGDVFYMGFYLMLFAGNIVHLWEANSIFILSSYILLSVLSMFVALVVAFTVPPFNMRQTASFFNLFYVLFSAANVFATLRPAMFDRAWILRTLAFGIFTITEVWFAEWLYFGFEPPDPSIMWLGVVMLAVLSQKPIDRRMRIVRF